MVSERFSRVRTSVLGLKDIHDTFQKNFGECVRLARYMGHARGVLVTSALQVAQLLVVMQGLQACAPAISMSTAFCAPLDHWLRLQVEAAAVRLHLPVQVLGPNFRYPWVRTVGSSRKEHQTSTEFISST